VDSANSPLPLTPSRQGRENYYVIASDLPAKGLGSPAEASRLLESYGEQAGGSVAIPSASLRDCFGTIVPRNDKRGCHCEPRLIGAWQSQWLNAKYSRSATF